MWKGAEATLKPKPTNMSAVATYAKTGTLPERSTWLIASILVEPVAPNMSATPSRKNAVANDPKRKYFKDDSLLEAPRRRKPASTYVEIDEISRAIKISTSSMADDIRHMPTVPNRISP